MPFPNTATQLKTGESRSLEIQRMGGHTKSYRRKLSAIHRHLKAGHKVDYKKVEEIYREIIDSDMAVAKIKYLIMQMEDFAQNNPDLLSVVIKQRTELYKATTQYEKSQPTTSNVTNNLTQVNVYLGDDGSS